MLEPDRDQLEIFVNALFRHAGQGGYVSLRSFLANSRVLKPIRAVTMNGDGSLIELIGVAEDQARRAGNSIEPAVFCPPIAVFNSREGWQAREQDLYKGLALSVECDENPDQARWTLEELLGPATIIVRSGGTWLSDAEPQDKLHLHWRLSQPATGADGLAKLKQARELAAIIAGADPTNVPVVHCLRWPGSWHRKSTPRLCEIFSTNPDAEIELDIALAELTAAAPAQPRRNGQSRGSAADWGELAGNIIAGRELHRSIARLAAKYIKSGMSAGAAVNQLRGLMDISAARQERPGEWQDRYDDIVRAVESAEQKYGTAPPEAPAPSTLEAAVNVFGEWLALADATPLYAMLGTVVANLLPGDPVWLGIIAPPSSAKTELLNSLSKLPYVAVTEALSPAALLSGTPKRQKAKNASGGLLKQVGDFGILAFKDFGTVLEMRLEARSEMLAALRRVFDGEYVRQVGSDGGQTITWRGKVGLIFGSTQKYDLYHGVIGTLGDRFLLIRIDTAKNQFAMCFKHVGKATTAMRDALANAVAGLFAGLPKELPELGPLSKAEMQELEKTVMLAVRLRAGVERDRIKRDIEAVYDPEGPARLALSLERLFAGLIITGLDRAKAMKIIQQVAMDSTPRFRLQAYNALTADWQTTREIATTLELPTTTTQRALEDLVAQGLARREDKEGGANRWRLNARCQD
jgi:hypothetical protein